MLRPFARRSLLALRAALVVTGGATVLAGCKDERAIVADARPVETRPFEALRAQIERVYPHDPQAFTQGLVYSAPWVYESTGLEGRSSVRRVELATGRVDARVELSPELFGEGL